MDTSNENTAPRTHDVRDTRQTFTTPTQLLEGMLEPEKHVVRLLYTTLPAYGDSFGNTFIAEGVVKGTHDGLELELVDERHNEFYPRMAGDHPAAFNLNGTPLRSLYIELIGEAVRGGDGKEHYVKRMAKPLLSIPTTAQAHGGETGFH